jgi:selenide,water dikinase
MWHIDENRIGILTLDFVTPIVDDPYKWGEIAAANALSDVFAMGGKPMIALNIVAFPVKTLDLSVLEKILLGGHKKVSQAGGLLVGGHSIEDEEPKYGLCVFGEVQQEQMWQVTGARPGDVLILTKPIGTGVISTAIKADMIEDETGVEESIRWMSTLNDLPLTLGQELLGHVHACTDVTGFGLVGHTLDMLSEGKLDLIMGLENVPLLPGAIGLAEMGLVPAGTYNNRIQYEDAVLNIQNHPETLVDMVFDAQTSGGLLLAVPENVGEKMVERIRLAGFERTAIIGTLQEGHGNIRLEERLG